MKRILWLVPALSIGFIGIGNAVQPVMVVPGLPDSRYSIENSSVTLSSFTVTTIPAGTPTSAWREIRLQSTTSFYYRIDGVTSNITTAGYPVAANTTETIETNGTISLLLPVGVAANSARVVERKK